MSGRLAGRVALVTGSDSGIGRASAVAFAREGADVVVHFLHDADGAEETRRVIEAAGVRSVVQRADVGEEAEVATLFDAAVDAFGRVDVLMNCAAVDAADTPVADMDLATWRRSFRANVDGAFLCCRRFAQLRRERGEWPGGRIITVTSVHQDRPNPGGADYDSTKGALASLTRGLALELAPLGVTVNVIAPGLVRTPMTEDALADPETRERMLARIPLGRPAEAEEIAGLALFLASEDASYCTGATLVMDGGLMLNGTQAG